MLNTNTKLKYTMAHAVANKAEPGINKGSRVALELLAVNYILILSLTQ